MPSGVVSASPLLSSTPSDRLKTFLLVRVSRAISSGELSSFRGRKPPLSRSSCSSLPGRVPHLCVSGLLEAHVDPVVPGDAAHVARQAVAHGHRAEKLVAVEHAPVAVLDDHAVADLALRGDEQSHPLPLGDGDRVVVHEALELGRGHAAARDVVLVEINHVAVPDEDASPAGCGWAGRGPFRAVPSRGTPRAPSCPLRAGIPPRRRAAAAVRSWPPAGPPSRGKRRPPCGRRPCPRATCSGSGAALRPVPRPRGRFRVSSCGLR